MTLEQIQQKASEKRHEAKQCANALFKIPEEYSNGTVECMVDSIIACAVLEIAAIQKEASLHRSPPNAEQNG